MQPRDHPRCWPHPRGALGLPFGGLSGIDYDPKSKRYIGISDDRSEIAPARFYTFTLPMGRDRFRDTAPRFEAVTTLLDTNAEPFARRAVDPESIRYTPDRRSIVWSSEGAASSGEPPFVRRGGLDGTYVDQLPLPTRFDPVLTDGKQVSGVRSNQATESVTYSPSGKTLAAAVENALLQDGPAASPNAESPSRVVQINRAGRSKKVFVYLMELTRSGGRRYCCAHWLPHGG